MKQITVRLPDELYRRLKHLAVDQDVFVGDLILAGAEFIDGRPEMLERARELSRERRERRRNVNRNG